MRKVLLSILFTVTAVGCSDYNFIALGLPCVYDEETGQLMLYQHPPKLPIPAPPDGSACKGDVGTSLNGRISVTELHRNHYLNRPVAPQPTPTQLQEDDVMRVHRQIYWESYQPLQPLWAGSPTEQEEDPRQTRATRHDTRTLKRLLAVTASGASLEESYAYPTDGAAGATLSGLPAPYPPEDTGGCNLPWCRSKATSTSYATPTPDGTEWEYEVIESHYSQYLMQRSSESVFRPTPISAASPYGGGTQGMQGSQFEPDSQVAISRILPLGVENLNLGATEDNQPIVTSGAGGVSACPCQCDCQANGRVNGNEEMQVMTVTSTIIITTTVVMPCTPLASSPTLAPIAAIM